MRLIFADPGRLSARLDLHTNAPAPDGQGGTKDEWVPVASLWGEIEPRAARAGEAADVENARITHRALIRARADVRRGMRFIWRGRTLEIRSLYDPDERGRYLLCQCEEVAP